MRIAYVTETYPPEINGVALSAARAVDHLRGAGHAVQLLRPRQRDDDPGDPRDPPGEPGAWLVRGCALPMYPDLQFGLVTPRRLRRAWAAQPPQLVHVATPGPLGWAALKAAQGLGIARSADFRTNFHDYSRYYGLGAASGLVIAYLRTLHAMAQCNFVPTLELAARLRAQGFADLAVVPRGVDLLQFTPAWRSAALRARWGARERDPVLLYVGRLAAEKNVALALAAFDALRPAWPRARMVVVGDGPQRQRLERACPQAIFAGVRRGSELAAHYASADVFVFPSLTDTFGNVSLEAMASGLAVAAFDTAAAGALVADGVNGFLAPRDDIESFLRAVRHAVAAAAAPGSPVRVAARRTAERQTWDRVLRRFTQRLEQLAGGRPSAGVSGHAHLA